MKSSCVQYAVHADCRMSLCYRSNILRCHLGVSLIYFPWFFTISARHTEGNQAKLTTIKCIRFTSSVFAVTTRQHGPYDREHCRVHRAYTLEVKKESYLDLLKKIAHTKFKPKQKQIENHDSDNICLLKKFTLLNSFQDHSALEVGDNLFIFLAG